tara:strand:+ start:103268 stop:103588 length:321 start_codon:yes stop_codon:yes gene_type:complete
MAKYISQLSVNFWRESMIVQYERCQTNEDIKAYALELFEEELGRKLKDREFGSEDYLEELEISIASCGIGKTSIDSEELERAVKEAVKGFKETFEGVIHWGYLMKE